MGIRFRKYITFGKLLRLNISKSGISTTIGVKGASINIGSKGIYGNVGISGTGIYSRTKISGNSSSNKANDTFIEESPKIESNKIEAIPHINLSEYNSLFEKAAVYVIEADNASIYAIKKHFDISYSEAGQLMDELEKTSVISSSSPTEGRKVLITLKTLENAIN